MQIERSWGYMGKTMYDPMFTRMFKPKHKVLGDDIKAPPRPQFEPVKILFWEVPSRGIPSHTLGLDLIYLGLIVFSVILCFAKDW